MNNNSKSEESINSDNISNPSDGYHEKAELSDNEPEKFKHLEKPYEKPARPTAKHLHRHYTNDDA